MGLAEVGRGVLREWMNEHDLRMTPKRWIVLGWCALAVAALLALVGALQVFGSVTSPSFRTLEIGRGQEARLLDPVAFLRGLVLAVLAGVAFFSGLACFFWSASRRRQELFEEILQRLPPPSPSAHEGAHASSGRPASA
ncbi:hypothetical protein [Actinomadura sp. 21ATH]|uniref:hypothetical protein n=1 Tax=Actinomadura sp. 21ATH TaxID=1735444 RepID=UPI0035C22A0F